MATKMHKIKYECQHPSCQVFCKKGVLQIEDGLYKELDEFHEEEGIFKSPRELCRMGFSQPLKVLEIEEAAEGADMNATDESFSPENDPVALLIEEHKFITEHLDTFEDSLKKRDVDALWLASSVLENDIMLHSVKKEESALFPLLGDKIPMGDAYMQIMHEDHKEFLSLLHSFRCALQDGGEILDGIINSVIVNLRNHIKKENEEFFLMVRDALDAADREKILSAMKKIEELHVVVPAGDMNEKVVSPYLENRKYMNSEIAAAKSMGSTDDWSCH